MKSFTILFIVICAAMLACVIPCAAQENSLNILLKGSPETVRPGDIISYDIWYDAGVCGDWFADHIWLFFTFDPRIEIMSAPLGLMESGSDRWGDFTPGLSGKGWLSELIGGTFIGKIKPDTIPGSIIVTTAEIHNCLERFTDDELFTENEFEHDTISATSTSMITVEESVPVPEFPNPVPVILSCVGMLAVVIFVRKNQ
jgi:hypothetical protein